MEKAVRTYKLDVGNGRFASVGVSLGAAAFPNSGETLDEILIAADKAMYAVKEQRKAFSQKKKQSEIQSLRRLEEIISAEPVVSKDIALERDEFIKNENNIEETQEQTLILELDESHIISSNSIN